jgi:hypothetical protein
MQHIEAATGVPIMSLVKTRQLAAGIGIALAGMTMAIAQLF